jgi:hypothetical protein
MKTLAIYDKATGKIKYTLNCKEDDQITLDNEEDSIEVEGAASITNAYILNKTLTNKGECPSSHHEFDYTSGLWVDPRSLIELQEDKWKTIKEQRSIAEFGGFTWDSSVFDSDSTSQSRIQGAAQLATLALMNNQPFVVDWTLANNAVRTLTAEDMLAVGTAMGTHITTQHGIARNLRELIFAATTVEELSTIAWPI